MFTSRSPGPGLSSLSSRLPSSVTRAVRGCLFPFRLDLVLRSWIKRAVQQVHYESNGHTCAGGSYGTLTSRNIASQRHQQLETERYPRRFCTSNKCYTHRASPDAPENAPPASILPSPLETQRNKIPAVAMTRANLHLQLPFNAPLSAPLTRNDNNCN